MSLSVLGGRGILVDGSGPFLNIDLVCTCFSIDWYLCFDEGGVVGRSCVLSGVDWGVTVVENSGMVSTPLDALCCGGPVTILANLSISRLLSNPRFTMSVARALYITLNAFMAPSLSK